MKMSPEAIKLHEEVVASFLKDEEWSDKFSEEFLSNQLLTIYVNFLQEPNTAILTQGINALDEQYARFDTKHCVVIPLAGISMKIETLEIGRILLRRARPDYIQQIALGSSKGLSENLVKTAVQGVLKGKPETVCAEFRITAERIRAQERALDECSRALDVLRYAVPILTAPHLKISIGFEHDVIRGDWLQAFTSVEGRTDSAGNSQKNFSFSELILFPESVEKLEQSGALKLCEVLKKSPTQISEFEETVLRGVRWYSIAQKTIEPENKFLNLTTCLETFFTPREKDPITNAIAEGCAFVLCAGLDSRRTMHRRIKELYKLRSGLSHGGKTAILSAELEEMEFIAWSLLHALIKKLDGFQSREALREWIDEQKFR